MLPWQHCEDGGEEGDEPESGRAHRVLHDPVKVGHAEARGAHAVVEEGEAEVDRHAQHDRHPVDKGLTGGGYENIQRYDHKLILISIIVGVYDLAEVAYLRQI